MISWWEPFRRLRINMRYQFEFGVLCWFDGIEGLVSSHPDDFASRGADQLNQTTLVVFKRKPGYT